MADYTKNTGNSGKMMIRDTGTYVEFYITAQNSTTYAYQMPWAYVVNGVTSAWKEHRYEKNAGWDLLGRWNVTTTQTVTFKLGNTGTSGLGGPTTFSVAINRAKAPNPPGKPVLTNVTPTSVFVTFADGANNGAAIDSRVIGYGTNPTQVQYQTVSDGSTEVGALHSPGATWYFWGRTHNAKGWSAWGPPASVATIAGARIRFNGTWRIAVPYVKVNGVWRLARPWVKNAGVWKQTG